jgi:hypothetical protein
LNDALLSTLHGLKLLVATLRRLARKRRGVDVRARRTRLVVVAAAQLGQLRQLGQLGELGQRLWLLLITAHLLGKRVGRARHLVGVVENVVHVDL